MVVTLEWVRDHYDNNPKNRYIDGAEISMAIFDESRRTITKEQYAAIHDAWRNHILLPDYNTIDDKTTCVVSIIIKSGATLKADGVEVI